MAISEDNVRLTITMPKELKEQGEMAAKEDQRTIGGLLCKLLADHLKTLKK